MSAHSIGKTIASLRKAKGWTQVELAEKLNVSDKTVSKWESEGGLPEITQFPALAKLFDVSIDYLMTGKVEEQISLDDMDSVKRMFYLIKKDDVENYIKYDYPAKTYFDDFSSEKSAIACIIENKSKKIFNACVNNGIALTPSRYNGYTMVGAMYEHIDDLIKMACESDCLEFLEAIDFLSFAVGDKTQQLKANGSVGIANTGFKHTYNTQTAYMVSPDTFEFIFTNPTTSSRIIEYVSTYRTGIREVFYFFEQHVIEQLYKTKRFELLTDYIRQIESDMEQTIERYKQWEYDAQAYYKLDSGYLLRVDTSSYGKIFVIGKLIAIDRRIIELAISNLDEHWANVFIDYNRNLIKTATMSILRYESSLPFAPEAEKLAELFGNAKRQRRIAVIKENKTLTDKQRREQMFKENALSVHDAISANDYDLFSKFSEEQINSVSVLDVVNSECKDVRFYIHAINVDNNINNLNEALKEVLEKHPDRYDILNMLLSAGATVDGNLALTNILKQNVAINLKEKDNAIANIEVKNGVTKEELLKALNDGRLDYVVVNLTMVLEKKLKSMLAEQNMDLVDMIDEIHNNGTIGDDVCNMLHNLRKARNGIMHQGNKFYYTEPIVKSWVKIVCAL